MITIIRLFSTHSLFISFSYFLLKNYWGTSGAQYKIRCVFLSTPLPGACVYPSSICLSFSHSPSLLLSLFPQQSLFICIFTSLFSSEWACDWHKPEAVTAAGPVHLFVQFAVCMKGNLTPGEMEWPQERQKGDFPLTRASSGWWNAIPFPFLMICLTNSELWSRIHLNQFGVIK